MFKERRTNVKTMVFVALMVAAEIVLSRMLSISTATLKIGFGFLPIAVTAMLYGPFWAAGAAALADFLGAVLLPIGPYFPGFTLTALLTGAIFGLFLYQQRSGVRVLLAAVSVNLLSLLLNTLWISVLYGKGYLALLPGRLVQCLIMIVVQTVMISLVSASMAQVRRNKVG